MRMSKTNLCYLDFVSPTFEQPAKKERKHTKHSSSPGAMYRPTESQQKASANVCRSKSDVSTRKTALSEHTFTQPTYKRTESSPEVVLYCIFLASLTPVSYAHLDNDLPGICGPFLCYVQVSVNFMVCI